ncbi:MAG: DUF1294 domain-containing protein [Peptococcaceae bacterium]|nr:DUF1294 domain-containing protein [Peptococcaceae bacterium]
MRLTIVMIFLLLINIAGFAMMGIDKQKARRDQWRIPERNFFITALLGGSLGCYLGMQIFHHKTMHKAFTIGMPAILIIQIIIPVILYGKGLL